MAILRIPKQEELGLIRLRNLKEEQFKELIRAFIDTSPVLTVKELLENLAPKLKTILKEDLERVLVTLLGLYSTRLHSDLSPEEFTDLVLQAMDQSGNEELKLKEGDKGRFKASMTQLLSLDALLYTAKGAVLLVDHERVFLHAHTLTDVRSVFGHDIKINPSAAVIFHMLNITYRQDDREKSFYVALDGKDIDQLIRTLTRAREKGKSLENLLSSAQVSCLIPE